MNITSSASNSLPNILVEVDHVVSAPAFEVRANTYTTNAQINPVVTYLADGGWVVVWQSYGQVGAAVGPLNYDLYAQRYSADGRVIGSEFKVNSYTYQSQSNPSVAALQDGGWIIAWHSDGGDVDGGAGITAVRFSSDGSYVPVADPSLFSAGGGNSPTNFRVNTSTYSGQDNPSVTTLADGGWLIVWQSNTQDGSGAGIYGRRFNNSGFALGNDFRVNTYTSGDQSHPSVTALLDGGWLIAWQ